ncbi:agmatinase family protein [Engelhardtia mirabilis]
MRTESFDPNAAADPDAGLFGLGSDPEQAAVHVIPVGFDATTSFRPGAAAGPEAVATASLQVDLFDRLFGAPWRSGIVMREADPRVAALQAAAFEPARRVIAAGGVVEGNAALEADLAGVNEAGAELNRVVHAHTAALLAEGRLPVILGGDHAVPFGAIGAAARAHPGLGILHFDAHADLRLAYEGFEWSHASILRNVVEHLDGIGHVVQVGVRDLCDEEAEWIGAHPERITTLFDDRWAATRMSGADLRPVVDEHLARLPEHVWITFDVDGLDPSLCPQTGTPVPGGLSWNETMLWLVRLAAAGKKVVGCDLVEVAEHPEVTGEAPGASWDANVGARLLYRLIGCALSTR